MRFYKKWSPGRSQTTAFLHLQRKQCPVNIDAMKAVADLQPSDDSFVPKETQSKWCQANVSVPQNANRIQVSMDREETVSTDTHCSSLFNDIPLLVAAGLSFIPEQQCNLETASETVSDVVSDNDDDPDFDPLDGEDPEVDEVMINRKRDFD